MDILEFEKLIELPLKIKQLNFEEGYSGVGSWRGDYSEPALFFNMKSKYIPIKELKSSFDELLSGKFYEGYKGGEFSFENAFEIHFEEAEHQWDNRSILEFLALDSIKYLRDNKIEIKL